MGQGLNADGWTPKPGFMTYGCTLNRIRCALLWKSGIDTGLLSPRQWDVVAVSSLPDSGIL